VTGALGILVLVIGIAIMLILLDTRAAIRKATS
jgi:hypothetical protein